MLMEKLAGLGRLTRQVAQFPGAQDRSAWERLPEEDKADVLALAEAWRKRPYPMLKASDYASFVRTGSRVACEHPYFARRRKLIASVLHVCVTGTNELMADVEDGLWCLCEETTWAISAHCGLNAEHPFPREEEPTLDLFAAQTGMIVSLSCSLLEEKLHQDILRRCYEEVTRRVLRPFMERDTDWWMGFGGQALCNWTPWIVSNVMMSANVFLSVDETRTALYVRACGMLDRYFASLPADGGCDEGAAYWNMAGGALLDCLELLEQAADVSWWADEKLRAVLSFPAKVSLEGGWFVNFADCDARPPLCGERLQFAGSRLGNQELVRVGAALRGMPSEQMADVPHFSRLLMRLFHPALPVPEGSCPADTWLPDLQLRVVRRGPLTLCCKGGHNGESHNHNDVGSFMVYHGAKIVAVDAGNMTYTAKTFSDARYELWNCRSAYHNVPLLAGMEQAPGRAYAARAVRCLPNGLALDMAGAYPAACGAVSALRTMQAEENAVTVTDEVTFAEDKPVIWVLLLREKPEKTAEGWRVGDVTLNVSARDAQATVEELPVTDSRMAKCFPGSLWRWQLTVPPKRVHRMEMTFSI